MSSGASGLATDRASLTPILIADAVAGDVGGRLLCGADGGAVGSAGGEHCEFAVPAGESGAKLLQQVIAWRQGLRGRRLASAVATEGIRYKYSRF